MEGLKELGRERRIAERIPVENMPVNFATIYRSLSGKATVKDINTGGVCIEVRQWQEEALRKLLPKGIELKLEIHLPSEFGIFEGVAQVVWVKGEDTFSDNFRFGMKFDEISEGNRNKLEVYISHQRKITKLDFVTGEKPNRRKFARTIVKLPLDVELTAQNEIAEAETIDISENGAKIASGKPLGSTFRININLPPCYSESPMKASGIEIDTKVVWFSAASAKDKFFYGLSFVEMTEKNGNLVKEIIRYEIEKNVRKSFYVFPPQIEIKRELHSCNMYAVDLTIGCNNACLYCHFSKLNEEYWRKRYSFVDDFPIPVDISPIYHWDKFPDSVIYLSPSSDPFGFKAKELTHELLSFLLPKGLKFAISTKELIPEKTIKLFKQYLSQLEIEIGVTSLDIKRNNIIESNCPPASERLKTLQCLVEIKALVGARMDPLFPVIDDNDESLESVIKAVAKTGAGYITAAYLFSFGRFFRRLKKEQLLKESMKHLTEKSYIAGGKAFSVSLERKKQTYEKMNIMCRAYGIKFSVCGCKEVRLRDTDYPLICGRATHKR